MSITACILAKTKDSKLSECVSQLRFCNFIYILYTKNSILPENPTNPKVKTFVIDSYPFNFSKLRNFLSNKVKTEWVFCVDTDEQISPSLAHEILKETLETKVDGFYLKRTDEVFNTRVSKGELFNASRTGFIRLFKKNSGRFEGGVHEVFVPHKNTVFKTLKNSIIHKPFDRYSQFLDKINFYSTLRAIISSKNTALLEIFGLMAYPFFKFLYTFFLKKGYAEKEIGFIYSFTMSFHSFLFRAKKLCL